MYHFNTPSYNVNNSSKYMCANLSTYEHSGFMTHSLCFQLYVKFFIIVCMMYDWTCVQQCACGGQRTPSQESILSLHHGFWSSRSGHWACTAGAPMYLANLISPRFLEYSTKPCHSAYEHLYVNISQQVIKN